MVKPLELGPLERAAYHLVKAGLMTPDLARQYVRPLDALEKAGLIARDARSAWRDTGAPGAEKLFAAPKPVPMKNFVLRFPDEILQRLDAMGPTRSEAARQLIYRGLDLEPPPPRDEFGRVRESAPPKRGSRSRKE